ncbi:retrovirus-related pol polyprotein from transposon TNT 1-94 [Tanacetum coccineum]
MTKQERESMLYDEFDNFTSEPGESIHSYYLRYSKLINDIKIILMSMLNIQINTKFVNHLQLEWSRFVTAAKRARDLHSVNFDQLYAFLKHNERDSEESPPLQWYAPTVVQQPPTFQPDTELAIPTFLPTNDPIASLNKVMIFLSSIYSLRYPPINNQLRTLSNSRTQATIQNSQVIVRNVQDRQSQGYAGSARKNQASGAKVVNIVGNVGAYQPRVIRCYNCNGEGHIAKQCIAKKRLQAIANFKADHVDAYDSDCDDEATANAIFMANLSPFGSINDDIVAPLTELNEHFVSYDDSYVELTSDSNVISYAEYMVTIQDESDHYVPPPVQNNDMILSVIEQMKSQVEKCNTIGSWEQSDIKRAFKKDVIPISENLKETFKSFEMGFIAEVKEMKDNFEQIEDEFDSGIQKIEDENVSLAFQVSSLVKEREHIKLEYKKLYDSIKQTRAETKLQTDSLQQRLNDQISENNNHFTLDYQQDIKKCTKVLAPGLLKIESKPINTYFKNNKVVHRDYLKVTKEHVATLQELLEEARALKPFNEHIGRASKFAKRIQKLLVYVSDSCSFTQSENEKWAPATSHRKNNKPYVDASRTKQTIETITQKHAVKQNTRKTDNPM